MPSMISCGLPSALDAEAAEEVRPLEYGQNATMPE